MDVEFVRYQFEDGHYGVITKNKFKVGVRHIQMVYMFASSIAMGIIRAATMGVAVLAMTTRNPEHYRGSLDMSPYLRSIIYSSFFVGYAILLLPSELYFKKIGGKWLTTAILMINGGLCVAMPTIMFKSAPITVCLVKLLMGMSHGCFYVVNKSLMDKWLPPNEKQILNHFIFGGIQVGIVIGFPVSGMLLTSKLGWELVYYALGIMGLSMAVITGTLTASSPDDHQAVGDAEKEYLKNTLQYYRKKNLRKPWREILKSSPFWAVTCAHAASNALFILFLVYTPSYLMSFGMSLTDVRASGIIIGLTILPNLSHKWSCPTIIVLAAILGSLGFQYCGFLRSFRDMSENFSETLVMLSSTISSFVGCFVPLICGLIIGQNEYDPTRWRVVHLIFASLYIICNLIYTVFGSHDRQYWDHFIDRKYQQHGHLNAVMDDKEVQSEENGHMNNLLHKMEIDTAL